MCKELGTEPVEEDIPISLEDLPEDLQELLEIHSILNTEWDTNSGYYLGKDYTLVPYLFNLYNITNQKEVLSIILNYDIMIRNDINKKQEAKLKRASKNNGK